MIFIIDEAWRTHDHKMSTDEWYLKADSSPLLLHDINSVMLT